MVHFSLYCYFAIATNIIAGKVVLERFDSDMKPLYKSSLVNETVYSFLILMLELLAQTLGCLLWFRIR